MYDCTPHVNLLHYVLTVVLLFGVKKNPQLGFCVSKRIPSRVARSRFMAFPVYELDTSCNNRLLVHRKLFGISSNTHELFWNCLNFTLMLTHTAECLQSKYFLVILKAKAKFSTTTNWKKVSTNKCDIDRQLAIAILSVSRVPRRLLRFQSWTTTGNGCWNRKYLYRRNDDRVEIPTANPALSTMAYSIKVAKWLRQRPSTGNGNMWPPKPEIFISLELWQIGSEFQRQI